MKVKYNKKEFIFEITEEELSKIPPDKLARIMINKIENALYEECMETMLREWFING